MRFEEVCSRAVRSLCGFAPMDRAWASCEDPPAAELRRSRMNEPFGAQSPRRSVDDSISSSGPRSYRTYRPICARIRLLRRRKDQMSSEPPANDDHVLARWVATWKQAAPCLDEIRWQALRDHSPENDLVRLAAANDLIATALRFGPRRRHSGLVQQQRLFRKLRR